MQTKNNYSLKWNRVGGYGDTEVLVYLMEIWDL